LWVRHKPGVIGGPLKALKTSFGIDLTISLGSGTPFLGAFDVYQRVRVAMVSAESGGHTLQRKGRLVRPRPGPGLGGPAGRRPAAWTWPAWRTAASGGSTCPPCPARPT